MAIKIEKGGKKGDELEGRGCLGAERELKKVVAARREISLVLLGKLGGLGSVDEGEV